ncbi:MAG: class I SAM-dependent methyltransferase, partial [Desulfomonilaceae bacterium]
MGKAGLTLATTQAMHNLETHCPLCGQVRFLPGRFGLLSCSNCGLVIDHTVLEQRDISVTQEEWFSEDYATPKTSAWERWFEAQNNRRTYSRILSKGMASGRMLDIGIGSGSLLAFLKEHGWQVLGCDLSKAVCMLAGQRWSVHAHCGDVATLPEDVAYDLVVMNHVLEHVARPVETLQEVRRRMRAGGLLHLAVPNVACWEARLKGWGSYEPYHVLYFTPVT